MVGFDVKYVVAFSRVKDEGAVEDELGSRGV